MTSLRCAAQSWRADLTKFAMDPASMDKVLIFVGVAIGQLKPEAD